jgi:uncharacterized protein YndB with AHSA1/START domain
MNASQTTTAPVSRQIGAVTLTLASDTEIVMSRTFDAPRELVFRAHSSCEHMSQWFGRRQDTMPSCSMDFRPGGTWRFVNRDGEGNEIVFFGEYRFIREPERIDWTFGFEGMPGEPGPETLTLEDLGDGRTKLTTHSYFSSIEERDAVIASGMEHGAAETWDRLSEHLATMA